MRVPLEDILAKEKDQATKTASEVQGCQTCERKGWLHVKIETLENGKHGVWLEHHEGGERFAVPCLCALGEVVQIGAKCPQQLRVVASRMHNKRLLNTTPVRGPIRFAFSPDRMQMKILTENDNVPPGWSCKKEIDAAVREIVNPSSARHAMA